MNETCGYCNGTGQIDGRLYDGEGRAIPARKLTCEYCGGAGTCEDGGKLLGAATHTPTAEHARDLTRAGLPPWA